MTFEISPQKLVYGGEALGHAQGQTVLVPRVLPGEVVEAEPIRLAKGVLHARPLRVLTASPDRIAPPCPYFGACGGCHYQHLAAEPQTKWKVEILRETLRRIGKISWESEITVHQASPWNYRNQAELKVARDAAGRVELGFYEAESHRLVPIDRCLILSPRLNAVLAELREPARLAQFGPCRAIELLANDQDDQVRITLRGEPPSGGAEALAKNLLDGIDGVAGVAVESGGSLRVYGDPALRYRVGDFEYQISPGSFFQASRLLLPELAHSVVQGESGRMALDLYAGVGLFSLPLAQRFGEVFAVESNPAAARDLEANARAQNLGNLRVAGETAHNFLRRFARPEPDLVLLDPPRAGLEKMALKLLGDLHPRRLLYLSCHPPTWARDLGSLTSRGYGIEAVELFDLFPQTYHIECLARLGRANTRG